MSPVSVHKRPSQALGHRIANDNATSSCSASTHCPCCAACGFGLGRQPVRGWAGEAGCCERTRVSAGHDFTRSDALTYPFSKKLTAYCSAERCLVRRVSPRSLSHQNIDRGTTAAAERQCRQRRCSARLATPPNGCGARALRPWQLGSRPCTAAGEVALASAPCDRRSCSVHAAGSWAEVAQCTVRAAFGNPRPTHSSLCMAAVAPCREDGAAFSDGDADGKNNGL
jgi:hypothetical protein